jgi:hypothetical protein
VVSVVKKYLVVRLGNEQMRKGYSGTQAGKKPSKLGIKCFDVLFLHLSLLASLSLCLLSLFLSLQ